MSQERMQALKPQPVEVDAISASPTPTPTSQPETASNSPHNASRSSLPPTPTSLELLGKPLRFGSFRTSQPPTRRGSFIHPATRPGSRRGSFRLPKSVGSTFSSSTTTTPSAFPQQADPRLSPDDMGSFNFDSSSLLGVPYVLEKRTPTPSSTLLDDDSVAVPPPPSKEPGKKTLQLSLKTELETVDQKQSDEPSSTIISAVKTTTTTVAAAVDEEKEESNDWADRYAQWWNEKAWFPKFMGTDIPTFARFIFWHSLILTSITPLVRALTGVWKAEVPSVWILNMVYKILVAASASSTGGGGAGPTTTTTAAFAASLNTTTTAAGAGEGSLFSSSSSTTADGTNLLVEGNSLTYRVNDQTFTAKNAPEMDRTWILHASAGLMWLVVSYIQIAIIPKYGSKKMHRRTGPVALAVLFVHLGAALNTLINDHQKHQTLNKVALSAMTFYVAAYAVVGTQKAFAYLFFQRREFRDKTSPAEVAALLKEHINQMMIGWIWSLSGAGPIRMVGSFLEPLGYGPLRCQDQYGSLCPVECMWPYFNRMLWISSWNMLMIGCYCKIMQQKELTKGWVHNMNYHWKLCTFFFVLNMIPGSAQFVSTLLGGAANPASSIITYALWVVQAMQFSAFFPATTKTPSSDVSPRRSS